MPNGVQVGDKLNLKGVVTVHSVSAPIIDVSRFDRTEYLPGKLSVDAYANEITLAREQR